MNDVDILAEIRAWRDEFARVNDYDLSKMRAALQKLDLGPNAVMVRGTPRPPAQPFVEISPPLSAVIEVSEVEIPSV